MTILIAPAIAVCCALCGVWFEWTKRDTMLAAIAIALVFILIDILIYPWMGL